ncbi:MAG: hypothetical protein J6A36_01590 [Clostridia bacterium]|nr:hypothetical protein [Clostridia bacterium]
MEFDELRSTYKTFVYKDYKIIDDKDKIVLKYYFEIPGLTTFEPSVEILKKNFKIENLNTKFTENLVFNLGMIEAISYFKATCSPEFVIECGNLDEKQEEWFRKIFYLGLGEFRFINKIKVSEEEFVKFVSKKEKEPINPISRELDGIIIPIGGGKDSNVTLDLLKDYKDKSYAFRIGVREVPLKSAEIAGFKRDEIIEVQRTIDKNLLGLNSKGFLNGHTPFSAMVAFLTYLVAFLTGKKYVALSNEDSANESNVVGEKINHQYSKSLEFENDFRWYADNYLKAGVEYFSMLRPISELQIAMLFSKLEKYHPVFNSCNVGSKSEPWKWCCNCPKCLFVYTILSPFLYKEKLVKIFGEDLFEREDLLKTFVELCGYGETKPFECVGTYNEIRYAVTKTIENVNGKLPFLLKYYNENFEKVNSNLLEYYNENNNLPEEFEKILKGKILK